MKRNLYAVLLLLLLLCLAAGAERYVARCAASTRTAVAQARQLAEDGRYAEARRGFDAAAENSLAQSRWLFLLVRRSLMDEINESLAILAQYTRPDNLADLAVESARVTAQLYQLEASFGAVF